jgi:ammonium transporter, Amt family
MEEGMKKFIATALVLATVAILGAPLLALAADEAPAKTEEAAPAPPTVPDPIGANIGALADIVGGAANAPTKEEAEKMVADKDAALTKVADVVGHNKISINFVWTLICGFLVMFMQAGFAMAETGFTRAKNAGHTMAMNMMVYGIGMLGFWICGFALQMGGSGGAATLGGGGMLDSEFIITLFGKEFGLFGTKGFFLAGDSYDVTVFAMFLFQMVFMDTTATIPTGTLAERWTFKNFVLYAFFISMFVYPIYANWVWGGGWLSALGKNFALGHGTVDFAGSSVVHMTGGVAALAGGMLLGPRLGKFRPDGTPTAIPGHNIPMAVVGCFILAFGWFGFNAGSTLAGTDLRISVIATNTMLASAGGAFSAMMYMWMSYGKPDISMAANGLLAGLVAITAPCAFVTAPSAVLIGVIAGVILCVSVIFVERTLKIDDPVGAISVHGVNGAWGLLCVGIFADGTYGDQLNSVAGGVKGLLYGDGGQLVAQLIAVCANFVFVFAIMYVFFKVSNIFAPMRVDPKHEQEGLDMYEVAVLAYPEYNLKQTHR